MKASHITYRDTHRFSSTIVRYLDQDPELASFVSYWPTLQGFSELLKNKQHQTNRALLFSVLQQQYAAIKASGHLHTNVESNITALQSPNTFTVTTGHQLNLFTGPLYFIFKIVTTIKLASELKAAFPNYNFVPVYWMATEDHDFEEINHAFIKGKKVTWKQPFAGATGRLPLTEIDEVIKNYIALLEPSEHTQKLTELINNAYTTHATLADATRYLVNSLFGLYGLVIIDANHSGFKQAFASIMLQDIVEQNSFKLISQHNEQLKKIDAKAEVNPREINFFYLLPHFRERIIFKDQTYWVLNSDISFTPEELKAELKNHPERFSPNVVMRPLYQEFILPNIAYVGGGAEINYWLQLKTSFDHYELDFPILVLRNSALLVSKKIKLELERLGLSIDELFQDDETLQKHWIKNHSTHTLNLNDEWLAIETLFEQIKTKASAVSTTLGPSSEAVKARLHRMIQNLEKKLMRMEKKNHSIALSKIAALKSELFPTNNLQERIENFGSFYAKEGPYFIDLLINNFSPLAFKFTILQENKE